jgi:hypothetical protein
MNRHKTIDLREIPDHRLARLENWLTEMLGISDAGQSNFADLHADRRAVREEIHRREDMRDPSRQFARAIQ